jgi:hypothetical protein
MSMQHTVHSTPHTVCCSSLVSSLSSTYRGASLYITYFFNIYNLFNMYRGASL